MISRRRLTRLVAPTPWRRRILFWGGAVATGAAAVLFALGSDRVTQAFFQLTQSLPWWPFLAAPLGLACAAWLARTVFKGSEGSGIPQVIAALSLPEPQARTKLLSLRLAAGKMTLTILALASGASVGREGPTVQVGASIMHALGRFARFPAADLDRGLILAGGAAGIAAAFNTPLAGVVFAIEELARSFEERTNGTILTAVIIAGVTSIALVGDYTYFGVTSAALREPRAWLAVPVCGVIGGLAGGLFARVVVAWALTPPGRLGRFRSDRPVLFAAACGLVLAVLGWLSAGATFGTGYEEARGLLQEENTPVAGYALLKAVATLVSYASGVPGGIFAPSLAVGAGIGGELSPLLTVAPAGAVVLLTTAAYFAGVVQAPLTALVIVTEMTGNRELMLPLMGAVLLGRGTSGLVCREPLYRALSVRYLGDRGASSSVPR
ncbi:MAG TPA: chloride channel protein [Steroidobacteraceae bacterium]|nr:chloride channel protein [Steroidobacteraceae bacterium]